ncbi:hypothetical protein H0H87_001571, partial [Tephrocybe sp. NHM501043]
IIALMLGRLRMPIADAINYYVILVTKVYSGKVSSMNQRSKTLEEVLKEIVQQKTGDPEALLSDDGGPDGICKT